MQNPCARYLLTGLVCAAAAAGSQLPASAQAPARPSVYQTTLEEPNQLTPEITTEELMSQLRQQGIDDPAVVRCAYLEGDGEMSVLK